MIVLRTFGFTPARVVTDARLLLLPAELFTCSATGRVVALRPVVDCILEEDNSIRWASMVRYSV